MLGVIGPVKAGSAAAGPALTERGLPWIALTELAPDELAGGFGLALSPETLGAAAVARLSAQPGVELSGAAVGLARGTGRRGSNRRHGSQPAAAGWTACVEQAGQGVAWLGDAEEGARLAAALGPQATLIGRLRSRLAYVCRSRRKQCRSGFLA